MSIAVRRHHLQRLRAKRRHYWFGNDYRMKDWEKPVWMDSKTLGKVTATPHPCSCMGCGSPRRIGELTRQEIRFMAEAVK